MRSREKRLDAGVDSMVDHKREDFSVWLERKTREAWKAWQEGQDRLAASGGGEVNNEDGGTR